MRTTHIHRRPRRTPLTLEEALSIEEHHKAGRIDPSLPGTSEILAEAHRVRFTSRLHGDTPDDPRRKQIRATLWITAGFLTITLLGLTACFTLTTP